MVELAKERVPQGNFSGIDAVTLPFESESFDVVILFAVLTCIPDWDDQKRLIDEIDRVLQPGGTILMSGYPLQTDQRNLDRYAKCESIYDDYGLFEVDEGQALLRHHRQNWFERLFEPFTILKQRQIEIKTMNGNPSIIVQMAIKKTENRQTS
jgi:ubiquinone/menaquinone biosynthesis C-methylase UbiE